MRLVSVCQVSLVGMSEALTHTTPAVALASAMEMTRGGRGEGGDFYLMQGSKLLSLSARLWCRAKRA